MSSDAHLWLVVEGIARQLTDDTGRFRKQDLKDAVHQRLASGDFPPHIRTQLDDLMAKYLVRSFGERRNPKRRRSKRSWYHPDRIIKHGDGTWVWMKDAKRLDLPAWGRQSAHNNARQNDAEASKQHYIAERSEAFSRHPGFERLDDLERALYGFLPETTTPDDTADDE